MTKGPIRITGIYIAISLLWITFSDRLLFYITPSDNIDYLLWLGSVKGYVFVIATGVALYLLMRFDAEKLTGREFQYRTMYESNPNPMWIYDAQSLMIISVNEAAIRSYGYSKDEFLTKSILDIRPVEDRERAKISATKIQGRLNQSGNWRHLKKDGSLIDVNITSHRITFEGRESVLVLTRDMTERVLFEQQLNTINEDLRAGQEKLRQTQQLSRIGGWEFCPETSRLEWSKEVYEITGINIHDPRPAYAIYVQHTHPEDRQHLIAAMEHLVHNGQPLDVTHRIVSVFGDTRYIRQLADRDNNTDGPIRIVGSMQDITALKMLEAERNKYYQSRENTLNSMSDAFFAIDAGLHITRFNAMFLALVDKPAADVQGATIASLFPHDKSLFISACGRALQEKVIVKTEEFSPELQKWIRLSVFPDDDGAEVYFSDITENMLRDRKLKEAVERYELVAHATRDVIYDLDVVKNRLMYNTSLTHLVHVSIDQVEYDLDWWRSLIHPDDVAEVTASQRQVVAEGKTNWDCEYRLDTGGGEYKHVVDQGYFIYNDRKEPVRLIGAVRDIDELRRSNEENIRQNRLLKDVAWISSHELRRPVASVLGLMNVLDITDEAREQEQVIQLLRKCVSEMDDMIYQIHEKIAAIVKDSPTEA